MERRVRRSRSGYRSVTRRRRRNHAIAEAAPNASVLTLAARHQLPEFALVLVRDDVERTVGSLSNVADALLAIRQQVFLARDLLAFEFQAYQPGAPQPTDEQAVLPARERIARVPLRTGGCNDGIPVVHRLREAFRHRRGAVDRTAAVF